MHNTGRSICKYKMCEFLTCGDRELLLLNNNDQYCTYNYIIAIFLVRRLFKDLFEANLTHRVSLSVAPSLNFYGLGGVPGLGN